MTCPFFRVLSVSGSHGRTSNRASQSVAATIRAITTPFARDGSKNSRLAPTSGVAKSAYIASVSHVNVSTWLVTSIVRWNITPHHSAKIRVRRVQRPSARNSSVAIATFAIALVDHGSDRSETSDRGTPRSMACQP